MSRENESQQNWEDDKGCQDDRREDQGQEKNKFGGNDFQSRSKIVLCYQDLTEKMQESEHNFTDKKEQSSVLFEYITSKMKINEDQIELIRNDLDEKIHFFFLKVKKKYIESNQKYERFVSTNQSLLSRQFVLPKVLESSKPRLPPSKSTVLTANILKRI